MSTNQTAQINMTTDSKRRTSVIESFNFKTIGQLYAEPIEQQSYVWEGLLATCGLSILGGKPKAGKSTLARQIAAAIVCGKPCLARDTQQGGVLYFALEEKQAEVIQRFRKLGVGDNDPMHIRFGAMGNKKESLNMLSQMLDAVPEVSLVIIDPIFRFIGVRDGNSYTEVYDALEPLMEIARNKRVHILATHHMKKKPVEYVMDGALGSTAITGAVDAYLALNIDKSNNRTLCTTQRYGTDMEATNLMWNEATQELSLGITREQAALAATTETRNRIQTEILRYVYHHGPADQLATLNSVTGKAETKKQIFQQLKDTNVFSIVGAGVKGDPFLYSILETAEVQATSLLLQ